MSQIGTWCAGWAPQLLSVLRIITAFLFMQHGGEKLFSFPAPFQFHLQAFSLIWFAGVLEVFGGGLVLLGLFTRPVAFLLSGEMAIAYFMMHAPHGFWPLLNHGEAAVFYCFTFLYLASAGGGAWSLDRLFCGHKETAAPGA
jgi:putative oxidoreductase